MPHPLEGDERGRNTAPRTHLGYKGCSKVSLARRARGVKKFPTRKYYAVRAESIQYSAGAEAESLLPPPQRRLRQPVRLSVVFTRHVRDGKLQSARQLAAGPVQRVEPRTAAGILPRHLPHHYFRVGIDMQLLRLERYGVLQSFHQRGVFRDVVVLIADPLRDMYRTIDTPVDHHSNARRARISQAPAVDVGHQF